MVKRLIKPYENLGFNVCTDSFFTSYKLAQYLLTKKTTLLGTIRSNKRCIPDALKVKQQKYDSKVMYTNDTSLTYYQSKEKNPVYILSTMHKNVEISNGRKKLPETVDAYNNNKYGVDIFDKIRHNRSVKQKSRRWSMYVFFYGIDLALINSFELFKLIKDPAANRTIFLLTIAEELIGKLMEEYKEPVVDCRNDLVLETRIRCQIKTDCNSNKTFRICSECLKPVCNSCSELICSICYFKNQKKSLSD